MRVAPTSTSSRLRALKRSMKNPSTAPARSADTIEDGSQRVRKRVSRRGPSGVTITPASMEAPTRSLQEMPDPRRTR